MKLAGRRLAVALAVSASEAASLAKRSRRTSLAAARRDGPRDNRNLYLAGEGQVHEEGPAARGVSQTDIQKRRRAKEEQAMKLKNPNFFISKTRLQVRNVPLEMDQKQLKRVFFDAVKQRATQANPRVTHAKLLFDPTRPDANGKPRSRGIGRGLPSTSTRWRRCARSTAAPPRSRRSGGRSGVRGGGRARRAQARAAARGPGQGAARARHRGRPGEADKRMGEKETRGQKRRERERGETRARPRALGEQKGLFPGGRRRRVGWRARGRHESAQGRRSSGATTRRRAGGRGASFRSRGT